MSPATASADALPSQHLTTNSASPSLTGKRKRLDPVVKATDEASASRGESIHDVVKDLLEALESAYPLASTVFDRDIQFSHPATKRTKRPTTTASDPATTSIKAQVESKAYNSFEELIEDLDKAVDHVLTDLDSQTESSSSPSTQEVRSFQAEVRNLLAKGTTNATRKPLADVSGNSEKDDSSQMPPQGRSVLTLFGHSGHGQPRQYFASLKDVAGEVDPVGVDSMAAALLPNGIFTTNILPSKGTTSSKSHPKRTLKDIIPPPPSSYPYKPPPAPPSRATRSSVVEWYRPSPEPPKTRPGDKEVYAEQTLTLGQWLSYLSHTDTDETVSEKRLKRDRALSGGEGPDESELEFLQQQRNARARAQKSCLFRSAFSSFGPSRDDSNAVVPAETRSHLWWNKTGKDVYDSYTASAKEILIDPELEQIKSSSADSTHDTAEESRSFQEAVDAYVNTEEAEADVKQSKDEEDMLDEITDAIEALLVYQQERHKVLPVNGRTGASQQPSAAEQAIYETMQAQLLLILSQLPPSVVTRLNGDKLGKLSFSTKIPIKVPSYSGLIEELEKPMVPQAASGQARPVNAAPQQSSASRMMYQQAASTPPARPVAQPPRSAAATTTQYGNRTQGAAQYGYQSQTVQQPARTYQYQQQQQQQQAQPSPVSNGYRQQLQNGFQQYGQYAGQSAGSPATRPPHANQYSNRQQQGYQPRPGTYQAGPAQMTSPAAGRSASPQNPSSYSAVQNRSTYGMGQGQGQQHTNPQNGQHAAGYARPASGPNTGAAPSSFAMAGVKFSDEELAAIQQRRQMQTSPPQPQTPVGQRPPSANGIVLNAQTAQAPMPANGA